MTYNLKPFAESRKIFSALFVIEKIKRIRRNFLRGVESFFCQKFKSALHLSPNKQIKPSKRRFAANLSKIVRLSDILTVGQNQIQIRQSIERRKYQFSTCAFCPSFALLSRYFLHTLFYYFPNNFVAIFQRSFGEVLVRFCAVSMSVYVWFMYGL